MSNLKKLKSTAPAHIFNLIKFDDLEEYEKNYARGLDLLTRKLQDYFYRKLPRSNSGHGENYKLKGAYRYYGRYATDLIHILKSIKVKLGVSPSFMDYGCGPGIVVELAKFIGFSANGVDIVPEYLEFAEFGLGLNTVSEGNILKPETFRPMDVVYFWKPLADEKLEVEFEKLAIDSCKRILIHYGTYTNRVKGFKKIHPNYNIFERC